MRESLFRQQYFTLYSAKLTLTKLKQIKLTNIGITIKVSWADLHSTVQTVQTDLDLTNDLMLQ